MGADLGGEGRAGRLVVVVGEHPDPGGPAARADGQLVVGAELGVRLQDLPLPAELGRQVERLIDRALGVVGDDDDRVVGEEVVDAAVGVDELGEGVVGEGDRLLGPVGPVAVGVVVVVGEREEQEVVEVLGDQDPAGGGRVGVAGGRAGQGRLGVDLARGVELAVEELLRPPDGVMELGRVGERLQQPLEPDLVARPAAVDQKRRAGGPVAGVGEALEQRRGLVVEVPHVEVVDRVVERAEEAEGARRLERRAVLDVALLGPVVPVHPRDQMAIGPVAGRDLRGADGGDRGEGRDAVADQLAALDELLERRCVPRLDRAQEHVAAHGVDDDEN